MSTTSSASSSREEHIKSLLVNALTPTFLHVEDISGKIKPCRYACGRRIEEALIIGSDGKGRDDVTSKLSLAPTSWLNRCHLVADWKSTRPRRSLRSNQKEGVSLLIMAGGCGAMYNIEVESPAFAGQSLVKQHRLVNEVREVGHARADSPRHNGRFLFLTWCDAMPWCHRLMLQVLAKEIGQMHGLTLKTRPSKVPPKDSGKPPV